MLFFKLAQSVFETQRPQREFYSGNGTSAIDEIAEKAGTCFKSFPENAKNFVISIFMYFSLQNRAEFRIDVAAVIEFTFI